MCVIVYNYLLIFTNLRDLFVGIQPFVVVFNGTLGLIIGSMTLYLLFRTRPAKVKSQLLAPGAMIINWSGHPLPEAPWTTPFKVWTPEDPPVFNVESWETIQHSVQKMLRDLPRDLQLRLLHGDQNIVIVIPQLAAGLSILLATIHGQTGVFPAITSPLRSPQGMFWLPQPISLSDVRLAVRQQRDIDAR